MAGNVYYATSVSDTDRGGFPELKVVNMLPEKEQSQEGLVLQSRQGIEETGTTFGSGPIRSMFRIDGVLSNELFAVSGNTLHGLSTGSIGTIDGSGPVSIAGFEDALFVTAGESIWQYNAGVLSAVTFPDGADVAALVVGSSRVIAIRKDTGTFYWSDTLTSTIDPLSFATAENLPDKLKDLEFIGDTLVLFGSETVEFWPVSLNNPDLPFEPLQGRVFQKGIKATGCSAKYANSFAWVTNDNEICLGEPGNVISTPTIETKIEEAASVRLWTLVINQTEYLAVRLDTSTYIFSQRYGLWVEMESYGQTNWVPSCAVGNYLGSGIDGRLLQWSDTYQDFEDILERSLTIWVSIETGRVPLYNILCRVPSGLAPTYTYDPIIALRASRDGGFTFGDWKHRSLKRKGKYGGKIKWSSLGSFEYPGGLLELRVTDNVPFSFAGATVNDGY